MSEYLPFPSNPLPSHLRPKLSEALASQLTTAGVAQAVVVLRHPGMVAEADATGLAHDLRDAFVLDEQSAARMLLRAMRPSAAKYRSLARAGVKPVDADERRLRADPGACRAHLYPALGVIIGDVRTEGALQLAADERVEYVGSTVPFELVWPVKSVPAKLAEATTWGLQQLGVARLWNAGFDGTGVLVGHLDTGADGTHPALAQAIQHFVHIDEAGFPGRGTTAHDTGEHGTHTAATIAGRAVAGRSVGVAPGAKLAVASVIEGGDTAKRIITGLNWAVTQGVKIVSLSLGFPGYVADLYPIFQRLRERGVLPVVAAGNEGPGTSRSPGNYDIALSVGAGDRNRRVAPFSSSQHFRRERDPYVPDLIAPGVDVISAVPGGGWMQMSGTSMATPHVAGLAALLWQARPDATVEEIEAAIFASARRGSAITEERGGRGLVDGPRAYEALTGEVLAAARSGARARRPARQSSRVLARAKRPTTSKRKRAARPARLKSVARGR